MKTIIIYNKTISFSRQNVCFSPIGIQFYAIIDNNKKDTFLTGKIGKGGRVPLSIIMSEFLQLWNNKETTLTNIIDDRPIQSPILFSTYFVLVDYV